MVYIPNSAASMHLSSLETRQKMIRTKLNYPYIHVYPLFQEMFCKNMTGGDVLRVVWSTPLI